MIALTERSTRPRYAARGHWRTLDTEAQEWVETARQYFPVNHRFGHGWLAPDGQLIHAGEHYDLEAALDVTAPDLYDQGFVRVVAFAHSVGITMHRPLTASQRSALVDAARGEHWDAAYVDVRTLGGGILWSEQTDDATPRGLARILRQADQAAA